MRILFLSDLDDPRIGSSIRQMYRHAERLRALGHETELASAVQEAKLAGRTEIEGMPVTRIHSDYDVRYRGFVSLDNPRVREGVAALLASYRPDVVHAQLVHTHLGYGSLAAARRSGAGVV